MPIPGLPIQPKLMRTLEGMRVQRVGDSGERTIEVRIVAASSTDPGAPVERGTFRADLYCRLRQRETVMPAALERAAGGHAATRRLSAGRKRESDETEGQALESGGGIAQDTRMAR